MLKRMSWIILVFAFLLLLPVSIAVAQQIPVMPALCYGELTINGQPAPVGTLVVARVDNIDRGSIEVDPEGRYGGPGLESKLTVDGRNLSGKYVMFYISGSFQGINFKDVYAGEELYWGSGNIKKIDLQIEIDESDHHEDSVGDDPVDEDPPKDDDSAGDAPKDDDSVDEDPPKDDAPKDDDSAGDAPKDDDSGNDTESEIMPGDVNNDGEVNVKDVVLTMRAALDIIELNDRQKIAADVNKDNEVNVKDVVLIMRYALAIIDTF